MCLENLSKVLHRCKEVNLVPNWKKVLFYCTRRFSFKACDFTQSIEVDQAKIEVIERLPPPTCVKRGRNFLGHAGFYHRFIKDFSKTTKPLTLLLAKDTPFLLTSVLKHFMGSKRPSSPPPSSNCLIGTFLSRLCTMLVTMRLRRF